MSCKQIQELLPLYVGRDLEEKRERLVATHLESCAACTAESDEYRESRQLLQEFVPPAFSDAVYANMRREVLRDIESESTAPTFAQTLANLFRPRLAWAMATVVLIAFALFGLYFMTGRQPAPNQIAGKPSPPVPTVPSESPQNKSAAVPAPSDPGDHITGNHTRRRGNYRKPIPNQSGAVAVNTAGQPSSSRDVARSVSNAVEPTVFPARHAAKVMRLEMQTRDPNIRIIWFSQTNSKPISNSKGI